MTLFPPPQVPLALCLLQRSRSRLLCVTSHRHSRVAPITIFGNLCYPNYSSARMGKQKGLIAHHNNHFDKRRRQKSEVEALSLTSRFSSIIFQCQRHRDAAGGSSRTAHCEIFSRAESRLTQSTNFAWHTGAALAYVTVILDTMQHSQHSQHDEPLIKPTSTPSCCRIYVQPRH